MLLVGREHGKGMCLPTYKHLTLLNLDVVTEEPDQLRLTPTHHHSQLIRTKFHSLYQYMFL